MRSDREREKTTVEWHRIKKTRTAPLHKHIFVVIGFCFLDF